MSTPPANNAEHLIRRLNALKKKALSQRDAAHTSTDREIADAQARAFRQARDLAESILFPSTEVFRPGTRTPAVMREQA